MDQNTPAPAPAPSPAPAPMPSAAVPGATMYAGFWRRFAAAFVDGIIIGVVSSPLTGLLGTDQNTAGGVQFLIGLVYAVLMLSSSWQATVGKRALGIKVTTEDGQKLDPPKAAIRELSKIVSTVILFIGYLMMLASPKKQTLHDKIAKTVVVLAK